MGTETTASARPDLAAGRWRVPDGLVPVLIAFIGSRLMVCGVIVVSRLQLPPGHFYPRGGLLAVLGSGDAARYATLLQEGAWFHSAAAEQLFFPVFPLLLEMTAALFGNVAVAGVLIANACLFGAGMLLYRLMRLEYPADPRISRTAVMLMMFSPASYFFTAGVPDSTALLLAIGSLLAAVQRRWLVACVCALLLCGTVNIGFWIIVPLTTEFVRQRSWPSAHDERPAAAKALLIGAVFLPVAAAIAFGSATLQDPWAILKVSRGAEATLASLLELSRHFEGHASFYEWIFRAVLIIGLGLCVAGYMMKVRITYLVFTLTVIIVCFAFHDLQAARTLGLAFPLYIIMAVLSRRFDALYEPLLTCSMTLLLICAMMAANGFWIS